MPKDQKFTKKQKEVIYDALYDYAQPLVEALDRAISVIETECDDGQLIKELKEVVADYKP